eukprot:3565528-Rhodomonas_salina.2
METLKILITTTMMIFFGDDDDTASGVFRVMACSTPALSGDGDGDEHGDVKGVVMISAGVPR